MIGTEPVTLDTSVVLLLEAIPLVCQLRGFVVSGISKDINNKKG